MKLLFLFGDAAVGKMTVGQELAKITDLRLFHNHMTIEPVIFESFDGEIPFENYIKIDNSDLPPESAARMIKERFDL